MARMSRGLDNLATGSPCLSNRCMLKHKPTGYTLVSLCMTSKGEVMGPGFLKGMDGVKNPYHLFLFPLFFLTWTQRGGTAG